MMLSDVCLTFDVCLSDVCLSRTENREASDILAELPLVLDT